MAVTEVPTPTGSARLHVEGAGGGRLVLGHGAGGGIEARDLLAARDAALDQGLQVVRVEQPWRVRGARVAAAAPRLDEAWLECLAALPPLPCVVGGRSSGARVACRTSTACPDVRGVLCLAFPLLPPGRPVVASRASELRLPAVPRLVVQGGRDPFGVPPAVEGVDVHVVEGADHGFAVRRADGRTAAEVAAEIEAVVAGWLAHRLL